MLFLAHEVQDKTEHFKSDDLLTIACYQDFSTRAGNDRSSSEDQFSFCWQSKEGFKSLALFLCGFTNINHFLVIKKTALTSRHKINKTHTQIFGLQLTKFFFQLEKQSLGRNFVTFTCIICTSGEIWCWRFARAPRERHLRLPPQIHE